MNSLRGLDTVGCNMVVVVKERKGVQKFELGVYVSPKTSY